MDWGVVILLLLHGCMGEEIDWSRVRCASDGEPYVPEGALPPDQIGRFPWMGVIQHSFYMGGKTRFAVTGAVLIHPAYAIAPAEDIVKIDKTTIYNTTFFVVWQSAARKYSMHVIDYVLHPEYAEEVTYASFALIELVTDGETEPGHEAPVLPICMPVKGGGTFDDIYVVKMTDETGELQKEVFKMDYIENSDCNTFYEKADLGYKKMAPTAQLCAVARAPAEPCVWDGGAALVTRQSWGYWTLLGFGVRGPGCGAPARFLDFNRELPWVDERISRIPAEELPEGTVAYVLRQLSPVELIMYKNRNSPGAEQGQCNRRTRGSVMFKEQNELLVNKNFAQGFLFVSVAYVAEFTCVTLKVEAQARTNLAVWLEHHCHRDYSGSMRPPDYRKVECFMYFRTTAYMEFRFYFSFKVQIEMTLFGRYTPRNQVQVRPWASGDTTLAWFPTDGQLLRWANWVPVNSWWYYM